jgi:hypothetical protein
MNAPDTNGWIKGLEDADKDDMILVCVPTVDEDGETDILHAIAWWDAETSRWDGDFHYLDVPGAEALEATHWKPLNLPVEFIEPEEAEVAIAHAV